MKLSDQKLKNIVEASLMAADSPLSVEQLLNLFEEDNRPSRFAIKSSVEQLQTEYENKGIEIIQVASGFRMQVKAELSAWVSNLWEEKPGKYSRALMETLAIIIYRQPVTRGEIEDVRGVTVSSAIIKTLIEREWIRVLGHRDVPGKPAMFGTTRQFLDYFNLKSLDQLPTLAAIKDFDCV
ncbi:MAG: SMC-Scp complex subunit ScpB [Methylococcales bacterium]|jgi:segregation and condensation protein B|nr:SMC-Scp complex subunit ScpB [Methylococcales bacterium]MBT7410303.1 SMC-Scp complex subunit ScpB [Methylococcales bacterium]